MWQRIGGLDKAGAQGLPPVVCLEGLHLTQGFQHLGGVLTSQRCR